MTDNDEAQQVPRNVLKDEMEGFDKPAEVELHEDRTKEFKSPLFSRMITDWNGPERDLIAQITGTADGLLHRDFADAFKTLNDLLVLVRDPEVNMTTGEILTDQWGWPLWQRTEGGGYREDFFRLTDRDRENFIHQITTRMVDWEQRAANAWGEAMFAKAYYEEHFAEGYLSALNKRAEQDRTQTARKASVGTRHLGIFKSLYSRKADALVKSMERLCQRLKDTMQ